MKTIFKTGLALVLFAVTSQANVICGDEINVDNNKDEFKIWVKGIDLATKLNKYEKKVKDQLCKIYTNDSNQIINYSVYRKIESIPLLPNKIENKVFTLIKVINYGNKEITFNNYDKYLESVKTNNNMKFVLGSYKDDKNNKIDVNVLCLSKSTMCGYNFDYYTSRYNVPDPIFNIDNINEKSEKIKKQHNF